jgi:hypothetical protein
MLHFFTKKKIHVIFFKKKKKKKKQTNGISYPSGRINELHAGESLEN